MHLGTRTKLIIAGIAALVLMVAPGVASAQPSTTAACIDGFNATASFQGGDYRARFEHYGERLKVYDEVTDGYAAVAYVRVYSFYGCQGGGEAPLWSTDPIDTDRFVMDHGYHDYNLGTPDGSGDIAEDNLVQIRICKGYASNPGANCSGWKNGVA